MYQLRLVEQRRIPFFNAIICNLFYLELFRKTIINEANESSSSLLQMLNKDFKKMEVNEILHTSMNIANQISLYCDFDKGLPTVTTCLIEKIISLNIHYYSLLPVIYESIISIARHSDTINNLEYYIRKKKILFRFLMAGKNAITFFMKRTSSSSPDFSHATFKFNDSMDIVDEEYLLYSVILYNRKTEKYSICIQGRWNEKRRWKLFQDEIITDLIDNSLIVPFYKGGHNDGAYAVGVTYVKRNIYDSFHWKEEQVIIEKLPSSSQQQLERKINLILFFNAGDYISFILKGEDKNKVIDSWSAFLSHEIFQSLINDNVCLTKIDFSNIPISIKFSELTVLNARLRIDIKKRSIPINQFTEYETFLLIYNRLFYLFKVELSKIKK